MSAIPLSGDWRAYAACRGRAALFYAPDDVSQRIAVAVCRACPVAAECAAETLLEEAGQPFLYGVRAGRTAAQRSHESAGRLRLCR